MRLLVVGLPGSVHLARALAPLRGLDWDVHVFPSTPAPITPFLEDVTFYDTSPGQGAGAHPSVRVERRWDESDLGADYPRVRTLRWRRRAAGWLAGVVASARPDLVHAHELQHGGYLTFDARARLGRPGGFPPWIVSSWGADLHWFGRDPRHRHRLEALMAACDFLWAECDRDATIAQRFGFRGRLLPVLPIAGGFDLDEIARLAVPGPTSRRRTIAVKGREGWIYQGLNAMAALDRCQDLLGGYRLALYLPSPPVVEAARRLSKVSGVRVDLVERVSHEDLLGMHGRARVSISLAASDGICTSFLEAMAMGAFPVQSSSACADAWGRHGEQALFVPGDDPDAVAAAIRRALTDDALVDRAQELNRRAVTSGLDRRCIARAVVETYRRVAAEVLV